MIWISKERQEKIFDQIFCKNQIISSHNLENIPPATHTLVFDHEFLTHVPWLEYRLYCFLYLQLYAQELQDARRESGATSSDGSLPHYENIHAVESELWFIFWTTAKVCAPRQIAHANSLPCMSNQYSSFSM